MSEMSAITGGEQQEAAVSLTDQIDHLLDHIADGRRDLAHGGKRAPNARSNVVERGAWVVLIEGPNRNTLCRRIGMQAAGPQEKEELPNV